MTSTRITRGLCHTCGHPLDWRGEDAYCRLCDEPLPTVPVGEIDAAWQAHEDAFLIRGLTTASIRLTPPEMERMAFLVETAIQIRLDDLAHGSEQRRND